AALKRAAQRSHNENGRVSDGSNGDADSRPAPEAVRIETCEDIFGSAEMTEPLVCVPSVYERLNTLAYGAYPDAAAYETKSTAALVGPTGSGKSGAAICEGVHKAESGTPVLYVSTELGKAAVGARVVTIRRAKE